MKIESQAIKDALNRLRVIEGFGNYYLNDQTAEVLRIADELTEWIEGNAAFTIPIPNVTITRGFISLAIGDFCVWDSESCSEDELTLENCKAAYKREIESLATIFEEVENEEDE